VPQAELACGRVRDDGDVMAVQPVRPALRSCRGGPPAWPPAVVPTWRGDSFTHSRRWRCSCRVSGPTRQSGPDLSCEAETCRGGSSSGKLVGDAANWPKTEHLASVGLDQGLLSSLS
jgi:hypothetical protein